MPRVVQMAVDLVELKGNSRADCWAHYWVGATDSTTAAKWDSHLAEQKAVPWDRNWVVWWGLHSVVVRADPWGARMVECLAVRWVVWLAGSRVGRLVAVKADD